MSRVSEVRAILGCGHVENVVDAVGRLQTRGDDALARIATLEDENLTTMHVVIANEREGADGLLQG